MLVTKKEGELSEPEAAFSLGMAHCAVSYSARFVSLLKELEKIGNPTSSRSPYLEVSLNVLYTLLKWRLASNASSIVENTFQASKGLNLFESLLQLRRVRKVTNPRLHLASVSSLLDGIQDFVSIFSQSLLVARDECNMGESSYSKVQSNADADARAGAEYNESLIRHSEFWY